MGRPAQATPLCVGVVATLAARATGQQPRRRPLPSAAVASLRFSHVDLVRDGVRVLSSVDWVVQDIAAFCEQILSTESPLV